MQAIPAGLDLYTASKGALGGHVVLEASIPERHRCTLRCRDCNCQVSGGAPRGSELLIHLITINAEPQTAQAAHPARMTRASVTSPFSPKCFRSCSSSTYAGIFLMHRREHGSAMLAAGGQRANDRVVTRRRPGPGRPWMMTDVEH